MYAVKILISQPSRLILTIAGIALCIVLILYLLAVYRSVSDGSVEYIRKNKADLWVLQENSTNILRGTSLLPGRYFASIENIGDVESVSPVLLVLSSIKNNNDHSTIFLAGYNPLKGIGGPPEIIEGKNIATDAEIVLDRSFALKNDFKLGEYILIRNDSLLVTGLSSGTNALVIQYGFVTLRYAQSLVGFPGLVTCFLIDVKQGSDILSVKNSIKEKLYGIAVYSQEEFLANNIREMESGFLPVLYSIAVIGVIVLTTILSLILSISILEKKKDFAIIKILGSPNIFLPGIVIQQSLLIMFVSCITAVILYFPISEIIESISPEVSSKTSLLQIVIVLLISGIMSLVSALISIHRLKRIYPLEAFS